MNSLYLMRNLGKAIAKGFSVLGAVYSLYGMLLTVFSDDALVFHFTFPFAIILFCVSTMFFLTKIWYDLGHKEHLVYDTQRTVSVRIGDILGFRNGTILVGVNDSLEYNGDKIGGNSIHQQLLMHYQDNQTWIRNAFDVGKAQAKKDGLIHNGRYPMGYTFCGYAPDGRHYAFIVMSRLGETGGPTATSHEINTALDSLFSKEGFFNKACGSNCMNHRLYMPLLGAGVAPAKGKQYVAEKIAFQFIDASSDYTGFHHLVLVLRPHSLKGVDLASLNENIASYSKRLHHRDFLDRVVQPPSSENHSLLH